MQWAKLVKVTSTCILLCKIKKKKPKKTPKKTGFDHKDSITLSTHHTQNPSISNTPDLYFTTGPKEKLLLLGSSDDTKTTPKKTLKI